MGFFIEAAAGNAAAFVVAGQPAGVHVGIDYRAFRRWLRTSGGPKLVDPGLLRTRCGANVIGGMRRFCGSPAQVSAS
jgi:hypothetical protein